MKNVCLWVLLWNENCMKFMANKMFTQTFLSCREVFGIRHFPRFYRLQNEAQHNYKTEILKTLNRIFCVGNYYFF